MRCRSPLCSRHSHARRRGALSVLATGTLRTEDSIFPDTNTGWDHDADAGFDGEDVIIQLHLRYRPALQEIVRLCEPLVIVELCIRRDGGYVHGGRKLRHVLSPGLLAGLVLGYAFTPAQPNETDMIHRASSE